MKSLKIDKLGRVVIPIRYRKELGLSEGSEIDIECIDRKVIIRSSNQLCRICGENILKDSKVPLCQSCIEKVKKA